MRQTGKGSGWIVAADGGGKTQNEKDESEDPARREVIVLAGGAALGVGPHLVIVMGVSAVFYAARERAASRDVAEA